MSSPQFAMIHQSSIRELNAKGAPASALMVYAALCSYDFGKDGKVWPSMRSLAEWIGCDLKKVLFAINWLTDNGIVSRKRRKENRRANTYTLLRRALRWAGVVKKDTETKKTKKKTVGVWQKKKAPTERTNKRRHVRLQNRPYKREHSFYSAGKQTGAPMKKVGEWVGSVLGGSETAPPRPAPSLLKEWLERYGTQNILVKMFGSEPLWDEYDKN